MKRVLGFLVAGALVLATVGTVHAFEVVQPDSVGNARVETGITVDDSVFIAGQTVDIRGDISEDLFAAAGDLTLTGSVGGNVVSAGGTVTVSGKVDGDLIVVGGAVTVDSTATITGDVLVFSGTTELLGTVGGQATVYTGALVLNGPVTGDVVVQTGQMTLSDAATIGGSLKGTVGQPLGIDVDDKVAGTIDVQIEASQSSSLGSLGALGSLTALNTLSVIYGILTALVMGLLLIFLLPKIVLLVRNEAYKEPLPAAARGLLVAVAAPFLFILFMILFVTIPAGLVVFSVFGVLALLAGVFANLWAGDLIGRKHWSPFAALAGGALALAILGLIPVIGPLLTLIAWLVGLGAVSTVTWSTLKKGGK